MLKRAQRLRRASEFRGVFRAGVRVPGRLLLVIAAPGPGPSNRLGLAVGRTLGGAVQRNRAKRLIREAFRRRGVGSGAPLDIVVVPKRDILEWPLAEVERELSSVRRRMESRGGSGRPSRRK